MSILLVKLVDTDMEGMLLSLPNIISESCGIFMVDRREFQYHVTLVLSFFVIIGFF